MSELLFHYSIENVKANKSEFQQTRPLTLKWE